MVFEEGISHSESGANLCFAVCSLRSDAVTGERPVPVVGCFLKSRVGLQNRGDHI